MKQFLQKAQQIIEVLRKKKQEQQQIGKSFELPDLPSSKTEGNIQYVHVSAKSVAIATCTILAIALVAFWIYQVRSFLYIFFLALFLSAVIDPFVDTMERYKIPRGVGVSIVFIVIVSVITLVFASVIPLVIEQTIAFGTTIRDWLTSLLQMLKDNTLLSFIPAQYQAPLLELLQSVNLRVILEQVLNNFSTLLNNFKDIATNSFEQIGSALEAGAGIAKSISSLLFEGFLVAFLTFFMVTDNGSIHQFFVSLFPKKYGIYIHKKISAIRIQIGAWFRAQLLLSVLMFCMTFVGLYIIGLSEFALTLSLVMAVGEFIPYVGPILFLIFAIPVALGSSWSTLLLLFILHVVLQFTEGNIFVPAVMNKVVGLSPIVVMLVLLIGFEFFGIIGAILAVPMATALAIFITDYTNSLE